MAKKAPGKAHRKGISLMELADKFPTEQAAREWFEAVVWGGERCCGHCGSLRTKEASHKTMPYWCSDCRSYFSVKTGTALESSKLPLRKWAFAVYLYLTNLKGVSAMKLHRDIGISYKAAWFMLHRLREAYERPGAFSGPVEVDEVYIGGKRKNMSNEKRRELAGTGRGAVGKVAVVGAKDRNSNQVAARVIERTDRETLQGFVDEHASPDAMIYTDGASAYKSHERHESVKHSVGEYVRYLEGVKVHTNGVESLWSMLKRGYMGVYHRMSAKHLQRYINEFTARHNVREMDTADQMAHIVARLVGKRLLYRDLVA